MTVQPIDFSWMHEQISAEQYDAMTEEQCRDIEIVDGIVHLSPKPTVYHNDLAVALCTQLSAAGRPHWRATVDVDLRLRDIPLLNRQPDVLVYSADTPRNRRLPVSAVFMVAEIVSPGSETTDRVVKPLEYAEAGISHYWRVEIGQDSPVIHTYALDRAEGIYRKTGEFTGVVKAEQPFPVEIDLTDV